VTGLARVNCSICIDSGVGICFASYSCDIHVQSQLPTLVVSV
jgi:hypothetical protein